MLRLTIVVAVVLAGSCGSQLECGDGTTLAGTQCVSNSFDSGTQVVCGDGTTLSGGRCVATPVSLVDGGAIVCGPNTSLVSNQCVVMLPDSGVPTTCGAGTDLIGTQCFAQPSDGGIVCGMGTVLSGSRCVAAPFDGGITVTCGTGTALVSGQCLPILFDGGIPVMPGLIMVPNSAVFSANGAYVAYMGMAQKPGGPGTSYVITNLHIRTLATGRELVLPAITDLNPSVTFSTTAPKVLVNKSVFIDLSTETITPLTLPVLAAVPDLSGAAFAGDAGTVYGPLPAGATTFIGADFHSNGIAAQYQGQPYLLSVSGANVFIVPVGQPTITATIPGISSGNPLSPSFVAAAGNYVFVANISSQTFAVPYDGGTAISLGIGFGQPSPQGGWFAGSNTISRVASGAPLLYLGSTVARGFSDDSTYYFTDFSGNLRRVSDGGTPTLVDTEVEKFSFIAGGLVTTKTRPVISTFTIKVYDSTMTSSITRSIPTMGPSTLYRGPTTTTLSSATFITGSGAGSPWVASERWSWDVFTDQAPSPSNGVMFFQP